MSSMDVWPAGANWIVNAETPEGREVNLVLPRDKVDAAVVAGSVMVGRLRLERNALHVSIDGRAGELADGLRSSELEWLEGGIQKAIRECLEAAAIEEARSRVVEAVKADAPLPEGWVPDDGL